MTFSPDAETYLGDGLYASFDGYQIKLRAPDASGDREVFLDPLVIVTFERYLAELRDWVASRREQQESTP